MTLKLFKLQLRIELFSSIIKLRKEVCSVRKTYIDVISIQYKTGTLKPLFVVWDEKRKYAIDRVLNIRYPSDASRTQNRLQYTCMIHGCRRVLYYEDQKWYVESRS